MYDCDKGVDTTTIQRTEINPPTVIRLRMPNYCHLHRTRRGRDNLDNCYRALATGCPIRFLYFPTAGNWLSSFSILIPTLGKWLFFNSHCENWFNSIFPLLGIEWIQISYCRELIKLIHNLKSHYKKMIDF